MPNADSQFADEPNHAVDDLAWPLMTLPPSIIGERKPVFQALIKQSALTVIEDHGRASMACEVCGVLIGDVYRDAIAPLLYISAVIRGDPATGNVSQVTFTSQTWSHIHEELEEKYPGQKIVGWYHTHPGHGIFLSGMDLFIHQNFFDLPWQVALVFDPHSGEHGVFTWNKNQTRREPFLIEPDDAAQDSEKLTQSKHWPAALRRWFGGHGRRAKEV